jgi:hypothetical protein
MLASTEKFLENGFRDQVIQDKDLGFVLGGTPASRYALINKALEKNEIQQLCRGRYLLSSKYRSKNISKYYVAGRIVPNSFISFETALSFHGWIPERVNIVLSVIFKGHSRNFSTPLGEFNYIKMPFGKYEFLNNVSKQEENSMPFLMANPLRALMDYIYIKKIEWVGLDFLLDGMRIEREDLEALTVEDFNEISLIYTSKRVSFFLKNLRKSLGK